MAGFPEFSNYDAVGLAELVRKKDVHPVELVDEVFVRIERVNPSINAVVALMHDSAQKSAEEPPRGPFGGVPFLLKDAFFECSGAPLSNGSRFYDGYVPDFDSRLVARIKQTGLIIVGKTNVPEFALTPYTEPERFGPCRNPWNLEHTTGGSSGGAAAAVAARIVPMAHGSDGAGSIRIPASCCGLFGLKPTRARTPTGPSDMGALHGAVVGHVLSVSVRDSAALLDFVAGPEPGAAFSAPPPERDYVTETERAPRPLRVAFTWHPLLGHNVDPECVAALERTVLLLEELGHLVTEAKPDLDRDALVRSVPIIAASWLAADIREAERKLARKAKPRDFETETWLLAQKGRHCSGAEYVAAYRAMLRTGPILAQFFQEFDILLTPTLSKPPPRLGWAKAQRLESFVERLDAAVGSPGFVEIFGAIQSRVEEMLDFTPYTPVFNFTGHPAMSVPLEWSSKGLPIGLHFGGRYGDEATLFRLAAQLEKARPWKGRLPPVHA